jgi:hypothetical protein
MPAMKLRRSHLWLLFGVALFVATPLAFYVALPAYRREFVEIPEGHRVREIGVSHDGDLTRFVGSRIDIVLEAKAPDGTDMKIILAKDMLVVAIDSCGGIDEKSGEMRQVISVAADTKVSLKLELARNLGTHRVRSSFWGRISDPSSWRNK